MSERGGFREGSGRPLGAKNKADQAVKAIIDECVDMKQIIDELVRLVLNNSDTFAAKLLLEYRFGKPHQSVDVITKQELLNPFIHISKDGNKINLLVKTDESLELPA